MPPQKLGAFAMGAAMRRAGLDPEEVEILGETSGSMAGPGVVADALVYVRTPVISMYWDLPKTFHRCVYN